VLSITIKIWPVLAVSSGTALSVFAVFWSGFAFISRHKRVGFFLNPQDSYAEGQPGREFPLSAKQGTFEPLLKYYIGVAQLVFTVAAGSIAGRIKQSASAGSSARGEAGFSMVHSLRRFVVVCCCGAMTNTVRIKPVSRCSGIRSFSRSAFPA
jgi:hypothetical protein